MEKELGIQPLDLVLSSHSIKNDDLVKASREQLTHKQVQKARSGRRITGNIKGKIVRALNSIFDEEKYVEKSLFNY